jgi:hypothetical protein
LGNGVPETACPPKHSNPDAMPELSRGDSTELVGCHNAESELRQPDAKAMDVRLSDEAEEEEVHNDVASDALETERPPGWSGSLN